jgi:hypothetical protein
LAAVSRWLEMLNSTQTAESPRPSDDGLKYKATATIAMVDRSKVEGHPMTAADIVSGAATQSNFIKATVDLRSNASGKAGYLPDFTGTVEIRQIAATLAPSDTLSAADQANGITYRGSVALTFISRYTPSQQSVPTQYKDDKAFFSVTAQNGQIIIHPSLTGYFSLVGEHQATPPIFYPAEAFVSLENCARFGASSCT